MTEFSLHPAYPYRRFLNSCGPGRRKMDKQIIIIAILGNIPPNLALTLRDTHYAYKISHGTLKIHS